MSYTYTVESTSMKGGKRNAWNSALWSGMFLYNNTGSSCGIYGPASDSTKSYRAVYIRFDEDVLAELRQKTIENVSLKVTLQGGTIPASSNTEYQIGYKRYSNDGSTSSSTAWTRGNHDSTGDAVVEIAGYLRSNTTSKITTSGTAVTIKLASYVPVHGFCIGPAYSTNATTLLLQNSATMYVTTNETEYTYTLSYNANGGSNPPAAQTDTNVAVTPSCSFTVPIATPTRVGYTFSGWSETASGTATYSPGDQVTISSTEKILYAVWTKNSYAVTVGCLDPESSSSNTAAYFDAWCSDDPSTVLSNNTSLTLTKKYEDTIYINNLRPYYPYFQILSVDGMVDDGNGQYHYTLNENSGGVTLLIRTSRVQYSITYDANGGENAPASQTKYGGVSISLSSSIPSREGYTFVKWNTASDGTGTDYNPSATYETNASLSLYAIWVASSSTLTLSNYTCPAGQSVMIYINKLTPTAKHTITYSIGNQSGTIVTKTSSYDIEWTVPTSVVSEIPGVNDICTIYCTTFVDDVQSGVPQPAQLIVSVPDTDAYQPTVSLLAFKVNSNTIVDNWDILLQGYSQIELGASSVMATGATVVSYSFSGPSVSYLGPNNGVISGILDTYGKETWSVTVTDSRGRTATDVWDDPSFEIYQYQNPSISSAVTQRTDSTGAAAVGSFLKSKARLTTSSANGNNAIVLHKVEYKLSTDSTWLLGDDALVSNVWTNPYGSGLIDTQQSYDVKYTLSDSLGNTAETVVTLLSLKGIGIGLKNDRVHLGGVPVKQGLQVDWASEFNAAVTLNAALNGVFIDVSTISSGSSETYSISNNKSSVFFVSGDGGGTNTCVIIAKANYSGAITVVNNYADATKITVTTDTNEITIASASYSVSVLRLSF